MRSGRLIEAMTIAIPLSVAVFCIGKFFGLF